MNTQTQIDEAETAASYDDTGSGQNAPRAKKAIFLAMAALLAGGGLIYGASGLLGRLGGVAEDGAPVHEVEKELMRVTVTAGGALQAMRSHDVQSRVEGSTQILDIIPEGTIITSGDVDEGVVLMELDASNARENLEQQKITVQDASASLTQAREDHTIQIEQNESDIAQAELRVRFALMELKRYLGDELAARAVDGDIDFEATGWHDDIGGAALQARRSLENSVSLAGEELSRTEESLHWTRELVERGYVNRNELVADELQHRRRTVEQESAEEDLDLFLRYTLVKEAEERLSDYIEAKRNLERTRARARSRLAQAEANLRSRESSYNLQKERLERLESMIENSTVRATRPGLVVYASTTDPRRFRSGPVQEGLSVREGQTILSIPDLSTLAARVEVPEAQAQVVRPGQPAEISIDAMPDDSWRGEVRRISPMATQQWGMRALTGGGAGYETDVAFTGLANEDAELKPGMSATVEIEVARIPDALNVPIHAVHTRDGRRMCWVLAPDGPELREVELGYYTDTHVEVRRGLEEGERVLLARPERTPRHVRVVTLPERDPDDDRPPAMEPPPLPGEEAPDAGGDEETGREPEQMLESLDPEIRRRIEERLEDPDARERILENLQDPEALRQMIERMQNPGSGEGRSGDRRGDGSGRGRQ